LPVGLSLRALLPLVAPGVLVVLPAAVWLAMDPESAVLAQAAAGYPFAVLALALLFAWRFQRSRVFAAGLAVGGAHLLLRPWSFGGDPLATAAAVTLLPLVLAALALAADRRVAAPRGLGQVALVVAAATGAAAAVALAPDRTSAWLSAAPLDPRLTGWSGLEQPALAALVVGAAMLVTVTAMRRRPTDAGLAWALAAATAALLLPADSVGRGVMMLAAGLVLVLTLVESSYALAFHDDLTGLPARRALREALSSVRPPYAVAVVDVDRFKGVNDRYGHDVGDQVLRMVAAKLARVGGGGRAFRSGGEEFTLVFPGLTRAEALPHVEAVRAAVAESPFTVRGGIRSAGKKGAAKRGKKATSRRQLKVTISAGLAAPKGSGDNVETVVNGADRAMYRAKKGGRNRVM
jgi:GGDEF domain-containing protein